MKEYLVVITLEGTLDMSVFAESREEAEEIAQNTKFHLDQVHEWDTTITITEEE